MRKIQKTICREELISRIPALFAYIEENDAGDFVLHKATDSLEGCWGKIVENIQIPEKKTEEDTTEEETPKIIIENEDELTQIFPEKDDEGNDIFIYPYRKLITLYYQYKNYKFDEEKDENGSFIEFMDKAIGKVEIDLSELGLKEKDCDLVPHYIYLANVRRLINQYSKLKTVYDYYKAGREEFDINTLEPKICCICSKYIRMGGDMMFEKLNSLIEEAEETADKYYGYAVKGLTINLNINLSQSIYDSGYLSCYLNEWVGGDSHFAGELYTYEGNTYVCMVDNHDEYDDVKMTFEINKDDHFKKITEVTSWPGQISKKREITVRTVDDEGNITSTFNPYGDKFSDYINGGIAVSENMPLEGVSDSKLKSLRKFKQYINGRDEQGQPGDDEDWLYYYKIGLVTNYTTATDELGNILDIDDIDKAATNVNKLAAYGNVITDITYDNTNRTITFTYYTNIHLKANDLSTTTDDDGHTLYRYDGFFPDLEDQYHGVKYTETYSYEAGGELDKLINGWYDFTFNEYVNNVNGDIVTYGKFAFTLSNSIKYYEKQLDTQIVTVPYIKTDYETLIKNETDYLFADTFKTDYLSGITYCPTVEKDVRIDRGNYSAFERHLKLAEVKSMEDMENYSNNSFFNVQKTS